MNSYCSAKIRWLNVKKWLYCFAGLMMLVQIALSVIWMVRNFNTISGFGDTVEYIQLSKTFALDEYRPVLYPLLLRIARKINEPSFHCYIYILQTGLSLFSMCYLVYTIDSVRHMQQTIWQPQNKLFWLWGGLYLNSIPMITFMNLTILTDSIANSLLVLCLSICIQFIYNGKQTIGKGILLLFCLVGQCLIRADRLYSGMLLLVILAIMAVCKNPQKKRVFIVGTACILALTIGSVRILDSATQVKGRNGRVETNLSFILLDRIVWPHMAENYQHFPQEIRNNITLEEAQEFDRHNNNVMYQLAPLLESRVGKSKAEEYYRTMAQIVWNHSAKAVMSDIGVSILFILVTPLMHYLSMMGLYSRNNVGWNIHCLSLSTPELTQLYDKISFFVLLLTMVIALIILAGNYFRGFRRKRPFILWPFIIAGVLLCLWFTLGDGAPPNDRYMLIFYVTYALLPLMLYCDDYLNASQLFSLPGMTVT